jgi:hypothetical protein
MTIFLGCAFAAKYREGGGNFSVLLRRRDRRKNGNMKYKAVD